MKIEEDIVREIYRRTKSKMEAEDLIEKCSEIKRSKINVGENQLIRSMLIISNFKINEFQQIINSKFKGDPRDIILLAQQLQANFNYGRNKFE